MKNSWEVRERLVAEINEALTRGPEKFLISFKSRSPDWRLLGVDGVDELPAVRWKMRNLQRMPEGKHKAALETLQEILRNPVKRTGCWRHLRVNRAALHCCETGAALRSTLEARCSMR